MTKTYKVYLAGGIAHNTFSEATIWRKVATEKLAEYGIETLDPMRDKHQEHWQDGEANHNHPGFSASDIFKRDTLDIMAADALLVNLHTAKSVGTPWEMGYAYALGKPLFIVAPIGLHSHPFVCEPATFLTSYVGDAVAAVRNHLLNYAGNLKGQKVS